MKSKQLKIAGIVTITFFLLVLCLFCFHQGIVSHLDERQAVSYMHQLAENKYDSVRTDTLVRERTGIKNADRLYPGSTEYGIFCFRNHFTPI